MSDVEPRAKRQKSDRHGKSAAFERLRNLKGSKNKFVNTEVDNIYETVDESEYTKRVISRQEDDWIVDDDGSGYVEDGRDIFDDDLDAGSIAAAASSSKKDRKRKKGIADLPSNKSNNLQYMISNMQPNKKKKEEVKLDEDDILSELISEIDNSDKPQESSNKLLTKKMVEKAAAKDYLNSFNQPKQRHKTITSIKSKMEENSMKKTSKVLKEVQSNSSPQKSPEIEIKKSLKTIEKEEIKVKMETSSPAKDVADAENLNITTGSIKKDIDINDLSGDEMYADIDMSGIEEFDQDFDQPKDVEKIEDTTITEEQLLKGWVTTQESVETEISSEVVVDTSSLPTLLNKNNDKIVRFFWWDAFETSTQPGTVYLVGKIYISAVTFASCCLVFKDVNRKIFVLPRLYHENDSSKAVTGADVYTEFNNIANKMYIEEHKTRILKKNYAFDSEVPSESDYLEVRYSSKYPALPSDISGNTFSRVFGTRSSFLEILLLDLKIKGPCWFDIKNFEVSTNPVSWCKFEIICNNLKDIEITKSDKTLAPPPLVVAGLNVRVVQNPKTRQGEIVMITCLSHNKYALDKEAPPRPFQQHFCVLSKPSFQSLPMDLFSVLKNTPSIHAQKCDNERAMLNYFVNQFYKIDPDLVVGHDIQNYLKDTLFDRICATGASNWSRLGRLRRSTTVAAAQKHTFAKDLFIGRLVCDLKLSAQELKKSKSYDLNTLCQVILKMQEESRIEIDVEDIPKYFNTSQDIIKLIVATLADTEYVMKMVNELNVMPIALQITSIAGNVLSRTLLGGRSERNEFLLLHAFDEKNYIVPEKRIKNKEENPTEKPSENQRKKPTYSGGLVLEPKVGFYDQFILLMDFNSLYPSIIQEYNICFTTIPLDVNEENIVLPDKNMAAGILPTEIRKLVESRREVKKLMKATDLSKDLRMQYDIRQLALKLTANSMYGCLGFSNSRFYAKNLAALVTMKGREILTNTKELVQKMNYEVVYGDTDSIMVNTRSINYEEVFKIGSKIKQEINKLYKQVELDIDGVFKYLLLLKKKKYAAVTIAKSKNGEYVMEKEYKGLDIVRRDWCSLATEAGKVILGQIFMDQNQDDRIESIHAHLRKLQEDLRSGSVPHSLLIINKQLTKEPHQYADKKSLPHVQVALRYNSRGGKPLRKGDVVQYIICADGTTNGHTQRAYHVEELKNNPALKVDVDYYLANQIHPIIDRICGPIEGTDSYCLANALGIDTTAFKQQHRSDTAVDNTGENKRKMEFRFRNVDAFQFCCLKCQTMNSVKNALLDGNVPFLTKCGNGSCSARPVDYMSAVINQLHLCVRRFIKKYYMHELICEDPACDGATNILPTKFEGTYPICPVCEMCLMNSAYTEKDLYTQLIFFSYIFDLSKLEKKPLMEASVELGYQALKEVIEKYIQCCAYATVDLSSIFEKLHFK